MVSILATLAFTTRVLANCLLLVVDVVGAGGAEAKEGEPVIGRSPVGEKGEAPSPSPPWALEQGP